MNKSLKQSGFTIVELLVVIVVIGVLAAITIVSYAGISQRAAVASLQSDLSNYSRKLEIYRVEHSDNYPDDPVTAGIPAGSYSGYTKNNDVNPKTFTITATKSAAGGAIIYKVSNDSSPVAVVTSYATGGNTITDAGNYRIHTFTSSGTFTVNTGISSVQVLVVGGGGGGSENSTGGFGNGGAGGTVIYNANYAVSLGAITVTVGAGGAGSANNVNPNPGGNSVFGTITATGGGIGVYTQRTGGSNANYSGGTGNSFNDGGGGAGGGGASSDLEFSGGVGFTSSISGISVNYAGGGSSCNNFYAYWCGTAVDGGGRGAINVAAINGTANTGGGGGGGNNGVGGTGLDFSGGNGGSGIVIVRYLNP